MKDVLRYRGGRVLLLLGGFLARTLFLLATSLLISCRGASAIVLDPGGALPITGTFSDLRFDEVAGKLAGTEVRICVAGEGYEATVQFAEDDHPSNLLVVPVLFAFQTGRLGEVIEVISNGRREEERLSFDLPTTSIYGGTFQGVVTRTTLEGTFRFTSGRIANVNLPRRRGFSEQ